MEVKLVKRTTSKLVYEVSIELDDSSMLESEEQIQAAVNALGNEATKAALSLPIAIGIDTDGRDIELEGDNYTVKHHEKKSIKRPMAKYY